MIRETVSLQLKNGLEARPAALFVQIASKYESHISVVVQEKQVNAKSIMGMMSLGSIKGANLDLMVDGEDEREAADALIKFLSTEEAEV
ncbi:MAG: HPr family phosphocarrier protein [Cellulosilyticaceae bacterium]